LVSLKRATRLVLKNNLILWVASEQIHVFESLLKDAKFDPPFDLPGSMTHAPMSKDEALIAILRLRLGGLGPVSVNKLAEDLGEPEKDLCAALLALETEGFVFRGQYTPELQIEEWCERRLLQRIHKYTIEALRQSIEPICVQDFMRFLFQRHHMDSSDKPTGPHSLQKLLDQLEGYQSPAGAWESDIIPARLAQYDPQWLDVLCMSGKFLWGRFKPSATAERIKKAGPVKSTPIGLLARKNMNLWGQVSASDSSKRSLSHHAQTILEFLKLQGASFFDDMDSQNRLLNWDVEKAIGELVAHGLISNDSFSGLRALLTPSTKKSSRHRRHPSQKTIFGIEHAGRWSLIPKSTDQQKGSIKAELIEQLIFIYLKRWGILFRSILETEVFAPPWRVVVRVLRRLELKGTLRGGRFVAMVSGEQFARPETVEQLRRIRKQKKTGELISISAADPLNLLGILYPENKVSALTHNRILFRDGIPIAARVGKETCFLRDIPKKDQWAFQKALIRKTFPPHLRAYLGKSS